MMRPAKDTNQPRQDRPSVLDLIHRLVIKEESLAQEKNTIPRVASDLHGSLLYQERAGCFT